MRSVHERYPYDVEAARLEGLGLDIEGASGRDHHDFAIPSIFVVDRGGVVRWAHADPDYKVRPSTLQILTAIDGLDLTGDDGARCPAARRRGGARLPGDMRPLC